MTNDEWRDFDPTNPEDALDFFRGLLIGLALSAPFWVMLLALAGVL